MSEQESKSPSSPEGTPETPRRWFRGGVIALAVVGALVLVVGGGGAIVYAMGGGWHGHMSAEHMAENALAAFAPVPDQAARERMRAFIDAA